MHNLFVEDKTFDKIDFTHTPLPKGEYEHCIFSTCDFANSNLSLVKFISCQFINCNLSMAVFENTVLRDVTFNNSKMLGLRFDTCNQMGFEIAVENCTLNHSSFYKMKIKKTIFKNSKLQEVDFTETDLISTAFQNCDLAGAIFINANLEKANFQTAYNYNIDPQLNRMNKAKFSLSGVAGLLHKFNIEIDRLN